MENSRFKFRAWDKKKKRMILPSGAFGNQQYWSIESGNTQHWGMFQVGKKHGRICGSADNSGILMQYTGLKDKNGVEIYEGDIIKFACFELSPEIVYIEHSVGLFGGYELKDIKTKKKFGAWTTDSKKLEVIGNIYENPELLEQK